MKEGKPSEKRNPAIRMQDSSKTINKLKSIDTCSTKTVTVNKDAMPPTTSNSGKLIVNINYKTISLFDHYFIYVNNTLNSALFDDLIGVLQIVFDSPFIFC
ncbi:hypothetical protein EDEG_00211 [Edhazardia aedis USNM 41457]|uniref:Uncharacterized protein n=1 Tax=Edhazardia aedis (strain USNM 41457) TaxID=1003232 RepID=J9DPL9_EDHAE|nr:hypothetical protein EDEG_00211 [Edhazardia aedis USNM 41457]|eukprot:EJW03302.1 hypothetical protein EDEG_00211 [Edhazardia aedis USNM 41457]